MDSFWIEYIEPEYRKDNNDKPVRIVITKDNDMNVLILSEENFQLLEKEIRVIKTKLKKEQNDKT